MTMPKSTERTTVRLPVSLKAKLDAKAEREFRSQNSALVAAVALYVRDDDDEQGN